MEYLCSRIIVIDIGNDFVEVVCTERKVTLVVFDDDISKKSTLNINTTTEIYVPNDTIIYQLNKTPLIHGGDNS